MCQEIGSSSSGYNYSHLSGSNKGHANHSQDYIGFEIKMCLDEAGWGGVVGRMDTRCLAQRAASVEYVSRYVNDCRGWVHSRFAAHDCILGGV